MCGRYTLATPDPAHLRARFPVGESLKLRRRFNVAPGDEVVAVTTGRDGAPRGELLRWGLVPSWSEGPDARLKMINARVETLAERPAYRAAFERFRCLIVADGFYEWRAVGGKPSGRAAKQAFHITRRDRRPFAFAGLWAIWRSEHQVIRSCAIITTPANSLIAPLHDRMPAILDPAGEAEWLAGATTRARLLELLEPLPTEQTAARPVGPAVNDARYDGPECLAPPIEPWQPPPAAARQPSLF